MSTKAESSAELPFRTVPEEVLKAHKDRMGEIDVRVRRLADIQMIDGVDLMAMILEIEHYRSKPEPSNDLTKRLYGIAREYEEHNICTPGDEDRMVAAMREAADRLAFLERERAEQSNSLPSEVNELIDEALTFSHQDCGARDKDGYGCIRCAAENADMRRKSNESFEPFITQGRFMEAVRAYNNNQVAPETRLANAMAALNAGRRRTSIASKTAIGGGIQNAMPPSTAHGRKQP